MFSANTSWSAVDVLSDLSVERLTQASLSGKLKAGVATIEATNEQAKLTNRHSSNLSFCEITNPGTLSEYFMTM